MLPGTRSGAWRGGCDLLAFCERWKEPHDEERRYYDLYHSCTAPPRGTKGAKNLRHAQ